jgi:glycosyltransferase involved in cell wall biosynthesis
VAEHDPLVDIIIPTRGRGPLIDITVSSIRAGELTDFALWIVDQSDDSATEAAVAPHVQADRRVHYTRVAPRGSSAARNVGIAAGHAPYVAFTDDDCRAEPTWLSRLVDELSQPKIWAVFGRVIPDESYQPVVLQHMTPVSASLPVALKDAPEREVYAGRRFDLGFGHGANMAFRRERLEELGGFDEMLGVGGRFRSFPERDIGYRILRRGGAIVYTPQALIYHRHWRGWDDIRRTYRNYAIGTGAATAKYMRCGDRAAAYLLVEWFFDQGVRQVLSGLFKWRSRQKIHVGLLQMVYPWIGFAQGWRWPIDRERIVYVGRA